MRLFCSELGVEYVYVETDWDRTYSDATGLEFTRDGDQVTITGPAEVRGDVIAHGVTVLPWRQELVDFTEPMFPMQVWLIAPASSRIAPAAPAGTTTAADIARTYALIEGVSVMAKSNTFLDPELPDLEGHGARMVNYEGSLDHLAPNLLGGMAELAILDAPNALVALQRWRGKIRILGPLSETRYVAAAFPEEFPPAGGRVHGVPGALPGRRHLREPRPEILSRRGAALPGVLHRRGQRAMIVMRALADLLLRRPWLAAVGAGVCAASLYASSRELAVVVGLAGAGWWGHLRARSLGVRLRGEARQVRDLTERSRELQEEIERYRLVEAGLKRDRDAAEAASRDQGRFLADVSHEIRTPLSGVLGMTELVLDSDLDDKQREQLEIALESGRSLLAVINDILDVSAIESGGMRLATANFDPRVELAKIRRPLPAAAESHGLQLAWDVDQVLPAAVHGDPVRLRQMLSNLLGNAMKFTGRGTVGLRVRVDGGAGGWKQIEFQVHDTGIGIPKGTQDQAFELGLHICRRLVAMMGGELEVAGHEGEGSRFRFCLELPVAEAVPRAAPAATSRGACWWPRTIRSSAKSPRRCWASGATT